MNLYLKKAQYAYTDTYILKADLPLKINIVSNYDLTDGDITLTNGYMRRVFKLAPTIDVPADFIQAGRIYGKIRIFNGQTLLKTWDLSPITVKEVEGEINFADELLLRIKDLERRVAELEEKTEIIL